MELKDMLHLPHIPAALVQLLFAVFGFIVVVYFYPRRKVLTHISDYHLAKQRLKRRSAPIMAYVGANGSGKTFTMVYDTLLSLDYGRTILSTVEIFDYENPRPCDDEFCDSPNHPEHNALHPQYIRLTSYHQLLQAKNCDILLDEVQGFLSSRETSNLPYPVATKLMQLRKDDVVLRYSSPSWSRVDIIVREVTQYITLTVPYFAIKRKVPEGQPPAMWRDRLLFFIRSYDASFIDEFNPQEANEGFGSRPKFIQLLWRPTSIVQKAYSTRQSVAALGWASDTGLCLVCGGKRKHAACICDDHKKKEKIDLPILQKKEEINDKITPNNHVSIG